MPDLSNEQRHEGFQERKEKPQRIVIEIGANQENNYIKQYNINLDSGTVYHIVNVNYDVLPNEANEGKIIPLDSNSVDEVVLSNILSDLVYFDHGNQNRTQAFWESRPFTQGSSKKYLDEGIEDAAYFQKIRTIKDVVRILKKNGVLRIYENFNQLHPEVVSKIIDWLRINKEIEFTEDFEEEKRIQPLLDKDNQESIDFAKKHTPYRKTEEIFLPRKHNKVYKAIKRAI